MRKKACLANLVDYVKPEALIITETHLDADIRSSEFMPPGYSPPLRKNRNRQGGGILVAVKDCYTLAAVDLPTNPAEIIWGEVSLRSGKKLILGSYYRSPSGNAETQQSDFEKSLRDLKSSTAGKRDTSTIIVGFKDIDWETETAPPGSTERAASQKLITSLRDHHLSQMQREPTREKSVLDLYITNRPGLVKSMATIPSFSDHDGVILVDSDVIPAYNKKKPRKTYVFSQSKWCKMKEDITSFATSFLQQYRSRTVNENWEAIKDEINKTVEGHVPSRISSKKQYQPWISWNLKRKSRKKHRLYRKAKKSGDPAKMTAFRTFKKAVEHDAKKARITYINEHVIDGLEDGNTKPLYRYIKQLRMENLCLPPLKAGGSLITSACDKAATLLAEFSSVFTIEDLSFIPWLGPAKHKIQDILVYEDGVRKLLLQLTPHKASGPDRIPNGVLKELAWELAPLLTALYNQFLSSGTIPDDCARALVTPVYTKGDVHEPSNYRPVSLTTVACKTLEHIVCKHIVNYLERHKLLTTLQHVLGRPTPARANCW